jgi:hypothetical protein
MKGGHRRSLDDQCRLPSGAAQRCQSRMDAMATYEVEVRIMIPRRQTEEIPAGTLNRILKDLGLTRDQV